MKGPLPRPISATMAVMADPVPLRAPRAAEAPEPTAPERLRIAFDLFEAGAAMMRQNLNRMYPDKSADEIENMLQAWLHNRPGAEDGDAEGLRRGGDR